MPATLPHVGADVFDGLKRDDERALERLFRDWYATLIDEATPLVGGDRAGAARAVEAVFVQVWKARRDIASADVLESGLHSSLRNEASRIQSRRAVAHHMDELEGGHASKSIPRVAPPVDEAWSKVNAAIHAKHEAAVHNAAVRSRHEAAEQLGEIADKKVRPSLVIGGVAVLAAIVVGAMWFMRGSDETLLARGLLSADVRTTTTNTGQIANVPLSDGSVVKLGPESKARIPDDFGKKVRGLEMTGTAHFTVAPNDDSRFVVRAGPALITATGTEFTVRYYPAEHNTVVIVREGSVTIEAGDSTHAVEKGAGLVIADDSTVRAPTETELESLSWADGYLVLTDRPVRDVLVAFRHWYGVGVFTSDTNVLNRRVTMRMPVASFDAAVAELEKSAGVTREMQGANVVLRTKRR